MFCIRCGKKAVKDNLCGKCYLKAIDIEIPSRVEIKKCDLCGKIKLAEWRKEELEKTCIGELEKVLKKQGAELKHFEIKYIGTQLKIYFTYEINIPKVGREARKSSIIFKIKKEKCPVCVKKRGNYYEAVLQARGRNKENIFNEIMKNLKKDALVGVKEKKEGYDILVLEKKYANSLVRNLKKKYTVKTTYKLAGQKKDKKLYRNYYSVR